MCMESICLRLFENGKGIIPTHTDMFLRPLLCPYCPLGSFVSCSSVYSDE